MSGYNPIPIVSLETPRLLLRPVSMADAERVQVLFDDFEVVKYLTANIPWPYPETGARDYIGSVLPKIERQEEYLWAIVEKANLEQGLIGFVGLFPCSETDNRGFWLGREYWGRGYMTEVCAVVNDWAFEALGVSQLILNNAQPNLGSSRLKQKAGAELLFVEDVEFIGGLFPAERWRLTPELWKANRNTFLAR